MLEKHFVENVAGVQKNIYKQPNHTALPPFFLHYTIINLTYIVMFIKKVQIFFNFFRHSLQNFF